MPGALRPCAAGGAAALSGLDGTGLGGLERALQSPVHVTASLHHHPSLGLARRPPAVPVPPPPRARAAARVLRIGSTEAEMVAAKCGTTATRLAGHARTVFDRISHLGTVVAITRNAGAALEARGTYATPTPEGTMAGGSIQVRMRPDAWSHVFAIRAAAAGRAARTLAVFGPQGAAVHEVRVEQPELAETFDGLFSDLVSADQSPEVTLRPEARRPGQCRLDELRFCDPARAWPVVLGSLATVFGRAACTGTPLTVTVANPGVRQSWVGAVRDPRQVGQSVAVLDEGVRLHLRGDRIVHVWVSRRYTLPGTVTTLEVFDGNGDPIVSLSPAGENDDARWLDVFTGVQRRVE